ncbi:MAG: hypothetical protein ACE5IZ_09580 [Dehalococcoidia bacterium]
MTPVTRFLIGTLTLAVVLGGAGPALAQAGKGAQANQLYQEGVKLYRAGQYEEARERFVAALELQRTLKPEPLTTVTSHDTIGIFEHFYQITPANAW